MRKILGFLIVSIMMISQASAYHEYSGGPIVVNGQELSSADGAALMQHYGIIPAGNYWYDPVSGFWGVQGGSASFNLNAQAGYSSGGSAGGSGYNVNTYGGSLISDGNCHGVLLPGGSSVMSGNC